MNSVQALTEVVHYPNLKTVLMVEDILSKSQMAMTREQLKRKLPKQIMHQTLNVILDYLERSGKIYDGRKGIVWTFNPDERLGRALGRAIDM
ncbi:MAG: hypothetical protein NT157_05855 [Candidatus Micrarchaeota archaeon]|nr:hypothetical protein [Candidatus Micrarchaeota archaeon]